MNPSVVFGKVEIAPDVYADLAPEDEGPEFFQDVFREIFDEAFEILVDRQRKYGPTNVAQQGIYGLVTRMADDKVARVKQSLNGRIVNGRIELDAIVDAEEADTFEDGLFDIANYALMAIALRRGLWGRPLR